MKKIAIVALLTAFAATPALADNSGKFYVAGDLSLSPSYTNATNVIVATNKTTGATIGVFNFPFPNPKYMWRIAGGMHINPTVAVEIAYSQFTDSSMTVVGAGNYTLSASSFQVAAVGTYPLALGCQAESKFDLIGKLGIANNSSLQSSPSTAVLNGASSKTDLLMGVGVQYHINKEYKVRVQYDRFGKFQDSTHTNPLTANAISAGVVYEF
jgi:OOP family OmpA-OmpF porin